MQARPLTLNENIENVKTEMCLRAAWTVCDLLLQSITHSRPCIVENADPVALLLSISTHQFTTMTEHFTKYLSHRIRFNVPKGQYYLIKYEIVLSSRIHFIMNHFP